MPTTTPPTTPAPTARRAIALTLTLAGLATALLLLGGLPATPVAAHDGHQLGVERIRFGSYVPRVGDEWDVDLWMQRTSRLNIDSGETRISESDTRRLELDRATLTVRELTDAGTVSVVEVFVRERKRQTTEGATMPEDDEFVPDVVGNRYRVELPSEAGGQATVTNTESERAAPVGQAQEVRRTVERMFGPNAQRVSLAGRTETVLHPIPLPLEALPPLGMSIERSEMFSAFLDDIMRVGTEQLARIRVEIDRSRREDSIREDQAIVGYLYVQVSTGLLVHSVARAELTFSGVRRIQGTVLTYSGGGLTITRNRFGLQRGPSAADAEGAEEDRGAVTSEDESSDESHGGSDGE